MVLTPEEEDYLLPHVPILPNIFVIRESIASGNILLVILFLFWSFRLSKKEEIKDIGWVWVYTFAFGIAGGLPLFLYVRERKRLFPIFT